MGQVLTAFLVWFSLLLSSGAEVVEGDWRIWLEASFMKPVAAHPISGAERTLLAGGYMEGGELKAFSKMEWQSVGVDWAEFEKKAREHSNRDLEKVEVRYERDTRKVIRFAEIRSREPLVASAVLSPKFGELFENTLGEVVFVAVPNRYQAFVFPGLVGKPWQYTNAVLQAYNATAYPVSVELFECSKGQLRAIGIFQRP